MDKNNKPITTTTFGKGGEFEIIINDDNREILKNTEVHILIQEPARATADKSETVPLDLVPPTMGDENNAVNVERDPYGYQVKITAKAADDSGILRIYGGNEKGSGYYNENASEASAIKKDQILKLK